MRTVVNTKRWLFSKDDSEYSSDYETASSDDSSSSLVGRRRKFSYNCCGRKKHLKSLTHGGFYFGRFFILSFVTCLLLAAVLLDVVNVARVPITARQAKRSARGVVKVCDMMDDFFALTRALLDTHRDMFTYESATKCALGRLKSATTNIAFNCSRLTLRRYRAAMTGFWNATEGYLARIVDNELSCNKSRPFWSSDGFLDSYCRGLCSTNDDFNFAKTAYTNLSFPQWIDYALEVSTDLRSATHLYAALEGSLNDFSRHLRLTKNPNFIDIYGQEAATLTNDMTAVVDCVDALYGGKTERRLFFSLESFLEEEDEKDNCEPTRPFDFSTARLLVRYGSLALDSLQSFLDLLRYAAETLTTADEKIFASFWSLLAFVHGTTLLFLEYVVFAPNVNFSDFKAHVLSMHKWHTPFNRRGARKKKSSSSLLLRSQKAKKQQQALLPSSPPLPEASKPRKDNARRKLFFFCLRRQGGSRIAPLVTKEKEPQRGSRLKFLHSAARKHGSRASKHGQRAAKQGAKLTALTSKKVGFHVSDRHYAFRWWLLYVIQDILFAAILLALIINIFMMFLGDKRTCQIFYHFNGSARAYLRRFIQTAEGSCFKDLFGVVNKVPSKRSYTDERCDVKEADYVLTPAAYRVSASVVVSASFSILIIQWILLHWLPTAMCFARPTKLRKRRTKLRAKPCLHDNDCDSLDSGSDDDSASDIDSGRHDDSGSDSSSSPRRRRQHKKTKRPAAALEEQGRHEEEENDDYQARIDGSFFDKNKEDTQAATEKTKKSPFADQSAGPRPFTEPDFHADFDETRLAAPAPALSFANKSDADISMPLAERREAEAPALSFGTSQQ